MYNILVKDNMHLSSLGINKIGNLNRILSVISASYLTFL